MRKRELKNVEWSILVIALILSTIGLVALYSATQNTEHDEFNKQCIWLVVSIVVMIVVMFIDYQTLVKISPIFYRTVYNTFNWCIIYTRSKWSIKLV